MRVEVRGNRPFSEVQVGNALFHKGDFLMKTKRVALPDGETLVGVKLFGGDLVNATELDGAAMVLECPQAQVQVLDLVGEKSPTPCVQ